MSHAPRDCRHNWTSWTTSEAVTPSGERSFTFERLCTLCGGVEQSAAAIVEPNDFTYAKRLEEHSEPDD